MRYKVTGGTAEFGPDVVLQLLKAQVEPREHRLEKVEGGYRPRGVVQFKAGETVGLDCSPESLPARLGALLVAEGDKETAAKARVSAPKKTSRRKTAKSATKAETGNTTAKSAAKAETSDKDAAKDKSGAAPIPQAAGNT